MPEDRTLYISNENYKILKHAPEFINNEKLGAKAIAKGQVGEYDDMTVIKVPKGSWPANVNFMIVQKSCATFPMTLNETKLHEDPPGISGNLLEGRQIYDVFVFAARCKGVYVEVDSSSGKGSIVAAPTITNAGAISTSTSGATTAYTTDGSDPRYSDKTQFGTPASIEAGTVIKAYAYKEGCFPSGVTEKTVTG